MKKWNWYQPVSEEIFNSKYNLHNQNSIEEIYRDVALEVASVEPEEIRERVTSEFYDELISGRLIPAGRIIANARPGSPMKNYNNCFTIDVEDSMEGIYDSLKEDALISKMGGGVGFDISKLRPEGERLSSGGQSSGVISFLRIFDQSAKTIVTGGQRRSAHIALLDISHPDIEKFITVKRGDENKELTQFNISVKISDDFIKAVEADTDWPLVFDGKVHKTLRARELYDLLAKNAFIHNEPGIFNKDTVERYNNGYWAFKMDRVNPCGELVMPAYSLCCLSAVNLSLFVQNPFTPGAEFDFSGFERTVTRGIRFLDNVLDVTEYPLEKIETFSRLWRRIGLGFTGLADMFAMMGVVYGSDESLDLSARVGAALRDYSYRASSHLAGEKGSFPAYDGEMFLNARFVKKLPGEIRELIREKGIRNIQMNTVAPTGTTSLSVGHNCSSGIEPIFALQYDRNIRTGKGDETRKETVYDYGWLKYKEFSGDAVKPSEVFVTTREIDPVKSIDIQAVFQEYIDHSISKTLNLPPGTSFEQYKELFLYAYKKGLKGFTTFNPDGSLKGILEYKDEEKIPRRWAPNRPKDLPCDIHRVTSRGHSHIIILGFYHSSLYELFMLDDDEEHTLKNTLPKEGTVRKGADGQYDLIHKDGGETMVLEDFTRRYQSADASLGRLISMSLRHGTPLQFVIEQLNKDTSFIDFERSVSRVLKQYIKDGEEVITSDNACQECGGVLEFRDGCVACRDCGWSKCG